MSSGYYDPNRFPALSDWEREERSAALAAISRARRRGISVEDAASQLGVDLHAVGRWAAPALGRTIDGETFPTATDDIYRIRPLVLDGDVGFMGVADSVEADEADRIFATQWDYIVGVASVDDLRNLPRSFGGKRVVRDPRELELLARRGLFDIEEIYRELFG